MTKQLKRLNIQPEGIAIRPVATSGHRHINELRRRGKISYHVKFENGRSRTFKDDKKLALCYKFIMLLKIKSNTI